MIKLILVSFVIICVATKIKSQNSGLPTSNFIYSYDAAGNRYKRELIDMSQSYTPSPPAPKTQKIDSGSINYINKNNELSKLESSSDSDINSKNTSKHKYESYLGEKRITVYPNPTKGELKIDITNFTIETNGVVTVADMQGKIIQEIKNLSTSNLINISKTPNGCYVLKIVLDGRIKDWLIVKE
jgi:hypothetical protein